MNQISDRRMDGLKAILFDVGNTLVFPDRNITLGPLHDRGIFPTQPQIKVAEQVARRTLDNQLVQDRSVAVDRGYWDIYYEALLGAVGVQDDLLKTKLASLAGQSGNWSILADGAQEILSSLQKRYALAIVSNSDHRLKVLLSHLGIHKYFDEVVASSIVGYEKPDKRIFEAALATLAVNPEAAMYVGDIYSLDYVGATSAGMRAVLMDVYGVYDQHTAPRVNSLCEFHERLEPLA